MDLCHTRAAIDNNNVGEVQATLCGCVTAQQECALLDQVTAHRFAQKIEAESNHNSAPVRKQREVHKCTTGSLSYGRERECWQIQKTPSAYAFFAKVWYRCLPIQETELTVNNLAEGNGGLNPQPSELEFQGDVGHGNTCQVRSGQ